MSKRNNNHQLLILKVLREIMKHNQKDTNAYGTIVIRPHPLITELTQAIIEEEASRE